jgi:hypothetical protein
MGLRAIDVRAMSNLKIAHCEIRLGDLISNLDASFDSRAIDDRELGIFDDVNRGQFGAHNERNIARIKRPGRYRRYVWSKLTHPRCAAPRSSRTSLPDQAWRRDRHSHCP